jgi:hypothetical protein
MPATDSVYDLHVNKAAFEIMARSVYLLSLRRERIVSIPQVVMDYLDNSTEINDLQSAVFHEIPSLAGDIKVYVRLASTYAVRLAAFKTTIAALTERECLVREAVVFACAATIALNS